MKNKIEILGEVTCCDQIKDKINEVIDHLNYLASLRGVSHINVTCKISELQSEIDDLKIGCGVDGVLHKEVEKLKDEVSAQVLRSHTAQNSAGMADIRSSNALDNVNVLEKKLFELDKRLERLEESLCKNNFLHGGHKPITVRKGNITIDRIIREAWKSLGEDKVNQENKIKCCVCGSEVVTNASKFNAYCRECYHDHFLSSYHIGGLHENKEHSKESVLTEKGKELIDRALNKYLEDVEEPAMEPSLTVADMEEGCWYLIEYERGFICVIQFVSLKKQYYIANNRLTLKYPSLPECNGTFYDLEGYYLIEGIKSIKKLA